MNHAIAELERALETVEINAPINEAAGNLAQAQLERECAESYRAAIPQLKRSVVMDGDAHNAEAISAMFD